MIRSVYKWKGFYIGRYETGSGYVVKPNVAPQANVNWYAFYQKQKEMYQASSKVMSSMVYGSQWDQVMLWMYNDPATKAYVTDSTGKGNYSGSIANTGVTASAKVKNIYDMAGNVYDWTQEVNGSNVRILRRRHIQ